MPPLISMSPKDIPPPLDPPHPVKTRRPATAIAALAAAIAALAPAPPIRAPFMCCFKSVRLWQRIKSRPEAVEGNRNSDPLLGRLEDDEGCALALLHLIDEVVFH